MYSRTDAVAKALRAGIIENAASGAVVRRLVRSGAVGETARMRRSAPSTELVTVLFTDIVSSTDIAREVGDRRWRALVAAHHGIVRQALKRHQGRELDTAGDGFFATFPRPAEAIRCACEVSEAVREFGLEIRAGLHLGEAEVMGPKVGGLAVNTGARIMALGKAGEVLVSATVREAVAGKDIAFADHGVHQLKGLEGDFHVFDVVSLDGIGREPPLDPAEAASRRDRPLTEAATRRRWWPLAAAGVAVIGAIWALSALGTGGDDRRGSTSAPGPRVETAQDRALLAMIPAGFASSCEVAPLLQGAVAAASCDDGDQLVEYTLFPDVTTLGQAFSIVQAGRPLSGTSCATDREASQSYTVEGTATGKMVCFLEHELLATRSVIWWTNDQLLVLAKATREDISTSEKEAADLTLYEWWRTSGGPGVGGSFRPKDGPAELLEGTFRVEITPRDIGPSPKLSRDDYVGTWTLTIGDGEVTVALDPSVGAGFEETNVALFAKPDRFIIDHIDHPRIGFHRPCVRYESYVWRLNGDQLTLSDPTTGECVARVNPFDYASWTRVA